MADKFRLTLVQANPTVGDIEGNAAKAIAAWQVGREAGADMVGLMVYPKSPRHVSLTQACKLADMARGRAEMVAVTVNMDLDGLSRINELVAPDTFQFHGSETPEACALRETREEVGLEVDPSAITWRQSYERRNGRVWFFAAHLPAQRERDIVLGDEGQGWAFVSLKGFLGMRHVVPSYAARVQDWLDETGAHRAGISEPRDI